jgi:carbon monoxide dehydrogenase subunit G
VASSPYVIEYQGAFRFPIPPDELWDYLERVDRFESRLNWLSEFRLEGDGLRSGSVLHGIISPPVPYRMRVDVVLDACERPSLIEGTVHGDLQGRARLQLLPADGGTEVRAAWSFEMMQRPMRIAARFAHPLLRWGHDRVVEVTVNAFRRHIAVRR